MHENFDLAVDLVAGSYRGRVLASPAGEVQETLASLADVARGLDLPRLLDPSGADVAHLERVGADLFTAVFAGAIGQIFARSLDAAEAAGTGLRLRIRVDADTDRLGIPWELLYAPDRGRFLALSDTTPVCRYTELPRVVAPLRTDLPLRALALVAAPPGLPRIDVDTEWRQIDRSLENLIDRDMCVLDRLKDARIAELDDAISTNDYQILHLACHGEIDGPTGEPVVLFEGDNNGVPVTAADLAVITGSMTSLRLVILNSCLGAAPTARNPVSGTAGAIVRSGPPAVIAMQAKISDSAAVVFADSFYGSIASGVPVDVAVSKARRRVYTTVSRTQWAVPALFLRALDGQLFTLPDDVPTVSRRPVNPGTLSSETERGGAGTQPEISWWARYVHDRFVVNFLWPVVVVTFLFRPLMEGMAERHIGNFKLSAGFIAFTTSIVESAAFLTAALLVAFGHRSFGTRGTWGMIAGFALGMAITAVLVTWFLANFVLTIIAWMAGLLLVYGLVWAYHRSMRAVRRRRRQRKRV